MKLIALKSPRAVAALTVGIAVFCLAVAWVLLAWLNIPERSWVQTYRGNHFYVERFCGPLCEARQSYRASVAATRSGRPSTFVPEPVDVSSVFYYDPCLPEHVLTARPGYKPLSPTQFTEASLFWHSLFPSSLRTGLQWSEIMKKPGRAVSMGGIAYVPGSRTHIVIGMRADACSKSRRIQLIRQVIRAGRLPVGVANVE